MIGGTVGVACEERIRVVVRRTSHLNERSEVQKRTWTEQVISLNITLFVPVKVEPFSIMWFFNFLILYVILTYRMISKISI
jgi:hypothetical protein